VVLWIYIYILMVPHRGTIWESQKKFWGEVLGSGLEGGGREVFGFGH